MANESEGSAQATTTVFDEASLTIDPEKVLLLNRQLASMARLNMPMAKGLKVLSREVDDANFRRLIEGIQHDLGEGLSLPNALAKYPKIFSGLYLEVVKAGESTGNLAVVLEEAVSYSREMLEIRNRIKEALLYPGLILSVVVIFVSCFLVFVAPEFKSMIERAYAGHEAAMQNLPLVTKVLFAASDIVRTAWISLPVLALLVIVVVAGVQAFRRMGDQFDDFLFRVPLFRRLFKAATLMKMARTMRDLLANGVSMVQALRLTTNTVGRNRIRDKMDDLRRAVEEGGSFSRNLAGGGVFPDTMVWKLQMAEEKGIVEQALGELADEFKADVDGQTIVITKVLAPVMLLGMAFIVFLMFVATFVPLTKLSNVAFQ